MHAILRCISRMVSLFRKILKSDRVERLFQNDVVVDYVNDNAIEILHAAVVVDDLRLHDSRWPCRPPLASNPNFFRVFFAMNVYKKQTNRQKQIQYLNVINIATFLRCPASEYPPFARRERSPRTADRFVLPQCRIKNIQVGE
jgi:hypothetical protein